MCLTIEFSGLAREVSIPSLFDALNDWASSESKHLVVIIDEVQELSKMRVSICYRYLPTCMII
ncbi:hypothetical protein [Vulcanisaeta sp. JCM 16159]|uniref:hypothetical protein n=1 Tax=Vulcanisaeta sp. JCM 16159 TaxID=1295371 RepID=UPI0006CF9990|nr:hypothetical protein [Vulcanisaeta sp. JCM 16159]